MKNSEKIWNLLQSPNTFEMGMELLDTMVKIDPEVPYELFTQHGGLEWFQKHKDVRFPQLILEGFLSIWDSGDVAYADCLRAIHSLSLGGIRQLSQGHLDLFQNMPNLTLSVDWKDWRKLSTELPSALVVATLRFNCTDCVVSMVDLLTQVECTHLEIEYPPKSIRVIGDCLAALPKLQTLRCGVGEGVLIWLYRNKDLVHPVQTIQTGREMLTFAESEGTLQERVSSIKVSACVVDQPEYNAAIYPNLENFIVGDVLGDMVSFVRVHKDIPSMNVRQVYMKGINYYLYDVAERYGITFGRSSKRPAEALHVVLYGALPITKSVRAMIDVPTEVHRGLMNGHLTLNVYNIENVIEFGKLSRRRLWDTNSLRVFYRQVLALFRWGATLSTASLKRLNNSLVDLTIRDHLDLLDILLEFEGFGLYDVGRTDAISLVERLVETHFSDGVRFEKAVNWYPNTQHLDSYKLWWEKWQTLSIPPSSIKQLKTMEDLGLSQDLLDDVVLQLLNRNTRSKSTVEWMLVRIQEMLDRGNLNLHGAEQLMDRTLDGFEDTISLAAIRLPTNVVSRNTVDRILTVLLKHQIPCAPTEFHYVRNRENRGVSRKYGDWVVKQFTNMKQLSTVSTVDFQYIIGRLLKVLTQSNPSIANQLQVLHQHFEPSYSTQWLYQPWKSHHSMKTFDAILGENGDEWLLQGVTGLFGRSAYTIQSIERRIQKVISTGSWSDGEIDSFLCKQASTSRYISRSVSTGLKKRVLYALCRSGFHGLPDLAVDYFSSLPEVERAPAYRQLIQSTLLSSVEVSTDTFNTLFELGQKYNLDVSSLDDVLCSVKDIFATQSSKYACVRILNLVQQGQWSQEDYKTWLLTNYRHKFRSADHRHYNQLCVDLFACLMTLKDHDASNLPILVHLQKRHGLDFGVIKHVVRNISSAFQTPDSSLIDFVEASRITGAIDSEDFDALLQKSLSGFEYHSIIPDSWYQRALELIDQDGIQVFEPNLLGELTQVLLNVGGYSTTVDRSILVMSRNEGVPRLTQEVVPRYILQRRIQGVSLDVPEHVWFVRRQPTDAEVLHMVQFYQQGWTLFPTPHILQHMVHQIPNTPDGEVYLQDCVAYWCQETGRAWFEGWTMEKLLVGLRAVPNNIPQLDVLGTQMDVLPAECARFTDLQKLFVYNTGLSTIPQTMSLPDVEVLSISNTSLDLSYVLQLPSLKTLYCKNVSVSTKQQRQFDAKGVRLRF